MKLSESSEDVRRHLEVNVNSCLQETLPDDAVIQEVRSHDEDVDLGADDEINRSGEREMIVEPARRPDERLREENADASGIDVDLAAQAAHIADVEAKARVRLELGEDAYRDDVLRELIDSKVHGES
jgi:hypothetical protein